MNDPYDERPSLRDRLPVLIPVILIVLAVLGNGAFGALMIMPEWQSHDELQTQAAFGQTILTATAQSLQDAGEVLTAQLDSLQSQLDERSDVFLSPSQGDSMLDKLYRYAQESRVEIVDLQLQPSTVEAENTAYQVKTFRLQINGDTRHLIGFVTRIKEARVPSVVLSNLSIAEGETQRVLTMDLVLYTAPSADGEAIANLPEQPVMTPDAPTLTPIPVNSPTPTATSELSPTPSPELSPTPTVAVTPTETPAPTATPDTTVMEPGMYNDDSPSLHYTTGTWIQIASYQGTDGSYHYSGDPNAELYFSFTGTAADLVYVAFTNFGIFEVYVDGVFWSEVDAYAPTGAFGQVVSISGLPTATHRVTVRNTGQKNAASDGIVIAVDAVEVFESLPPTATPALDSLGR